MNATATHTPRFIHDLPVLTEAAAKATGYASITTDISATSESAILSGVCQWRNPQRCCLAHQGGDTYQLCILREDVRGADIDPD